MSTASLDDCPATLTVEMPNETVGDLPLDQALEQALQDLHSITPPLWPLADYVAVNPCVGLTNQPFLFAYQLLSCVRDCDLLMPPKYFHNLLAEGRVSMDDLDSAISQCQAEYPEWYEEFGLVELKKWLTCSPSAAASRQARFRTVADAVDERQGSTWSSHIINDVTRHCAAHFDEGQAEWSSPWRNSSLYSAWRNAARVSRRMDLLGLPALRAIIRKLPDDPRRAVKELLIQLEVPPSHWRLFLLCEAFSVAGWASYIRTRVRDAEPAGQSHDDLVGLLAIRLAYDLALARTPGIPWPLRLWPVDTRVHDGVAVPPEPNTDVLARYALQVAAEHSYRRALLSRLGAHRAVPRGSARPSLQMVFCIDVRSEVMRRNLESLHDSIETLGFAGFFGLPMEYVPIGLTNGGPQCPVLLQPSFQVHESLRGLPQADVDRAVRQRLLVRRARRLWKSCQHSAAACFSFVESLGLLYLGKLLTDSLQWTRPVSSAHADGLQRDLAPCLGPDIHTPQNEGLNASRRIELAEAMLRNLGLTTGHARLVVLCGHACSVTNNPYQAALDCGACGGHSGESNARVAAALLNDADVRSGLASRGITIPSDTWFLAAVHNTTTDEIQPFDRHLVPASHADDLAQIECWFQEAGRLSRIERCPRLGAQASHDVVRRSRDWSEVRPEWGLAGNAAFIVAPRSLTAGLDLGGRTFMHSYDHRCDHELKVLELIMTAPMVVTNWINLQYYASAVAPAAYGSGNKVLHNIVGQFGILQGNGGDLMTGLPWQSVHDGAQLQHEPLRLLVLIEAPRSAVQQIIEKHAIVRDLVTNGWVYLAVKENDHFYGWSALGVWNHLVP